MVKSREWGLVRGNFPCTDRGPVSSLSTLSQSTLLVYGIVPHLVERC